MIGNHSTITATSSCLLYGNRCCCNKADQLIYSRQLSTKVHDTDINDRHDLQLTAAIIVVIGQLHHYNMSTVFSNTSTDMISDNFYKSLFATLLT